MKNSKRLYIWSGGVIISLVLILASLFFLNKKISADPIASMCPADKNINLIVIQINESDNEISLYNKDGQVIARGGVLIGKDSYNSIGNPAGFSNDDSDKKITPLGVYQLGKTWSKSEGDEFEYNAKVPYKGLYIDLSGTPVDGGSPIGGLESLSPPNRHVGIHNGPENKTTTRGCMQVGSDLVKFIAKNAPLGTEVIVTDKVLSGAVSPVDSESYDKNYNNNRKTSKKGFSPITSVKDEKGDSVKIYNFGTSWIASVARPSGKYTVKSVAGAYRANQTEISYVRNADKKFKEVLGSSNNVLALAADGMFSRYFMGFYPDGYPGGSSGALRVSSWDTSYTNMNLPDKDGFVEFTITNQEPKCYLQHPIYKKYNRCHAPGEIVPESEYAIYPVLSGWHDLGFGLYGKAPETLGPEIGTFTYNYDQKINTKVKVKVDLSRLTETQIAKMKAWGIAYTQKKKINHTGNDYIETPQTHK